MSKKLYIILAIIIIFLFTKYYFNQEKKNILNKGNILLEHLNIINNIPNNNTNLLFEKIPSISEFKSNEINIKEHIGVDQYRYCIDHLSPNSIHIFYPIPYTNFKNNINKVSHNKLIQVKNSSNNFNDNNLLNSFIFKDVNISDSTFNLKINQLILEVGNYYKVNDLRIVGFFFYPKNGYIGWHTDKNSVGRRCYLTWANEDKKSFFRYFDNKTQKIITKYDKKGWTINSFEVKPNELFWHCVYSNTNRISIGFQF